MSTEKKTFKSIAIAAHPQLPLALEEAEQIREYLQGHQISAQAGLLHEEAFKARITAGEFDLCIALGGDGTMLRTGHICGPAGIPVLGINMGRLGYLMGMQREDWPVELPKLLAGDFWLEPRMMLQTKLFRKGKPKGSWDVLNEAIVSRGNVVRPVQLVTSVDGNYLTTYSADGIIAATPTGSTAYALAAGGPVLPPLLRNYLIVPIAPHLSFDRAIVLAEGSRVSIKVLTRHKAALSLDGQETLPLKNGDVVDVCASRHTVNFVRLQNEGYFYRNLTSRMNSNITDEERFYDRHHP
jgi:NAD+ kinase